MLSISLKQNDVRRTEKFSLQLRSSRSIFRDGQLGHNRFRAMRTDSQGETMAEFYLGQVMMTGWGFNSKGFALCNGQLLPIQQNAALFSLLGTYYGGNGTTNFSLPNLQSSTPVGQGSSVDPAWQPSPYPIGMTGGVENVTLLQMQMPSHTHIAQATTTAGGGRSQINGGFAASSTAGQPVYTAVVAPTPLSPTTIGVAGATTPHPNIQPYETISFQIALSGIFPSRN
jgi:microcystin-dependent protein